MKKIDLKSSNPPLMGRYEYFKILEKHLSPVGLANVRSAYQFAKYGHHNQYRDDGKTRYFDHVKAVSLIPIIELKYFNWRLLVMCLLHDIQEDSWLLTWHNIRQIFGEKVKNGIILLTKDKLSRNYVQNLIKSGDEMTILTKLCDRIHNMRTLTACPKPKQKRQTGETRDIYIPLTQILISRLDKSYKSLGEYLLLELVQLCLYYEKNNL